MKDAFSVTRYFSIVALLLLKDASEDAYRKQYHVILVNQRLTEH